jgi:hypothetical protein
MLFFHIDHFAQNLSLTTEPVRDQSNNIRHYLNRVAAEITDNSYISINSIEDWEKEKEKRYQELIESLSLMNVPLAGKRPPLNVKKVGTIQKKGYKIIKLYYESLPKLYVPANLYIPDNIEDPVPAILYVCGHSRTQKVHYQAHPRKFAQLGFICLIIETIQWGEVYGEHWGCYSNGWFHWYSMGYTPGGVETWNAIRGLDLLSTLPQVDKEKLGVTGISGGGAYSWYLAAIDRRIKAAAPVCGTSSLKAHIYHKTIDGHCDCMWPINSYQRDYSELGALIAPRPLLIASANRDGLNIIESVREVYQKCRKIYGLYGKMYDIQLVETPGGHSYHQISRSKIFSFFMKHLFGKELSADLVGDIDESESANLSEDELRVYVNKPPNDDRTKTIQNSFVNIAKPIEILNLNELISFRSQVLKFLRKRTFGAFPKDEVPLDVKLEFRADDGAAFGRNTYSFVSEKDWRLKVDLRWKNPKSIKSPIVLVLRNSQEKRWDSEAFLSELDNKYNIGYLEVRGIGETGWSPELHWHIRRAAAWTGRTVASMQVYDIIRCIEFLKTLEWVNPKQIILAARDEMTVPALYATLLEQTISGLILKNPPPTQNSPSSPDGRGAAVEMLNCLRITDLPQVAGLLFPRKLAYINALPESYKWAENIYEKLNKSENFQLMENISEFH